METLYFCLAVYNEEKRLKKCLLSINESLKKIKNPVKVLICLNGCVDKSLIIAKKCKKEFANLNIRITNSKKGKLNAQKKMISMIPENSKIFFVDADTEISKDSVKILLGEMDKHRELIAVGAFPIARRYSGRNIWKKILDEILNIRSRHPKSEISKLEVSDYHILTNAFHQRINTSKEHELKSKIFFHGRLFLLRSKKYWNMPPKKAGVVGDDSYLPDHIIYNYGKNRIRIRYDAIVYFEPIVSLREHYRSYKRIYYDLKNLKEHIPKFREIRDHSVLILDREYVRKQPVLDRVKFGSFNFIRRIEKFLYRIFPEEDPSRIW